MNTFLRILILGCVLACRTEAQPVPDALFTAGTTSLDGNGRPWGYLVFRPTADRVLQGRSLAIYRKRGLPADPGSFERLGSVSAQRDVAVLSVLIERGRQLGENIGELDGVLFDLYRTRVGSLASLSPSANSPPKPSTATLLSGLLTRSDADAETAQLLRLLGQAHPTVKMALGEAWAGPLNVAPGQPVTLEVREVTATGDGGVVGRVTLTAGQPVLLPPPGPPIQVPDLSPKGDLNLKLRWGQGDDLRRQSPLTSGFSVWRVLRSFAAAQGADVAAPSSRQLQSWASTGNAVRISEGPVLVSQALSLADAANLVTNPTNYFVVDDGNRYRKDADGRDVDVPLIEGTEYTYFLCSRDLLGRDGPPSSPGHGVVCRTLPPPVPSGLRVENHWEPSDAAGTQSIQFFWNANTNNKRDVTHYYEVFRGTNLTQLQSDLARSTLSPVSSSLPHTTDGATLAFLDAAPEIVSSDFGHTFWYSVRAVHRSPCGPIVSDFAAPVLIARRQREGPAAPSGFVDFNCHRASVISTRQEIVSDPAIPANDGMVRVRVLCQRLDPGIALADLSVRWEGQVTDLGQHAYAAEGDWVVADFEVHRNNLPSRSLVVICQTTTLTGALSNPKEVLVDHLSSEGRRDVTFQSRTLSDADLVPGEAFSDELLEPPVRATGAGASPNGAGVALLPAPLNGRRVVLQTSSLAAAAGVFQTTGRGLVRDGLRHFSVPPVPDGSQQPALTARAFAIREFGEHACIDLAYNPGTGKAGTLGITLFITPRSAEYRLFRRIDEGPYSLVAQGAAEFVAQSANTIRREDDALPATDCTICYYAQTVDRDGNASALVRLDPCVERKAPTLPKPNLAPPEAIGTLAAARMKLTWMCPPQGVERFLITIKAKGGAAAQSALERASSFSLTAPLAARVVQYFSAGGDQPKDVASRAPGPAQAGLGSDRAQFLGLGGGGVTFQKMVQTSSFVTPRLGNNYAATPPFTAEFDIQPGITYVVFVQAVRGPLFAGQGRGPASSSYEFKWEDPSRPEPAVAWPARPFESVIAAPGIAANQLNPVLWPSQLDGQRPVGIRIASMTNALGEDVTKVGTEVIFAPTPDSPNFRRQDPNAHWLGGLSDGVKSVQGVLLYRQQIANTLFPTVPGDTIQVSPLIRKIAWIPTTTDDGRSGARLVDPFFAVTLSQPSPNQPQESSILDLWLLDTQGVTEGARYHYYLVCLGHDGEVRRTLDAGFYGPQ